MTPMRILIADDDANLVRILTLRLKDLGFAVTGTHDAMHALTLMHKNPPDLVLLDLNMPAGNGLAVCEMIKSAERLKHIPLLIMTGDSSDATIARCNSLGVHYILKSPDVWKDIQKVVCQLTGIQTTG